MPTEHRLDVIRQCHDSEIAGHWGRQRTQELISRDFTWQGWKDDIAEYVAGCVPCQKSKSDRHAKQTKLVPMPPGK